MFAQAQRAILSLATSVVTDLRAVKPRLPRMKLKASPGTRKRTNSVHTARLHKKHNKQQQREGKKKKKTPNRCRSRVRVDVEPVLSCRVECPLQELTAVLHICDIGTLGKTPKRKSYKYM